MCGLFVPGPIPPSPDQDIPHNCRTCADRTGMGQMCFGCRVNDFTGNVLHTRWMRDHARFPDPSRKE